MKTFLLFLFPIYICAQAPLPGVLGGGGSGTGGSSGQYSTASVGYGVGTVYFPPGGGLAANATETNVEGVVTIAGTISNFSASLSAAPGADTITFTWRKNATDQTVTCSITASATSCTDTTHNFAVAVNDLVDIKAVITTGTVTAAVVFQWGTPGVAGPTGATGAGGGPGQAPYSTTTIAASPMSIPEATHLQGAYAFGVCWDASTNPQVMESCNWSRNPSTGDLTLTYSLAPAQIDIYGATGGFANPMTTLGDLLYENASPAAARIAGNTTSGLKILTQTGTGSVSAAPAWSTAAAAGIGTVSTVGFTGGVISVANPTTTPAFTVAGTSGGVPYFASASTWATSTAGTAGHLMLWGGAATAPTDGGVPATSPTANQNIRTIGATFGSFESGASALSSSKTFCVSNYGAGTIQSVQVIGDVSGSVTVDVLTVAHGSWTGRASATSITASAKPALSSAAAYTDSTLTGWTTTVAAGTDVCFALTSPTTVAGVAIALKVAAN